MSAILHMLRPPAIQPTKGRIVRRLNLVGDRLRDTPPKPGRRVIDTSNDGQAVLACLAISPGITREQLQHHMNWPKYRAANALTALHAEKRVRLTQVMRIRRWFVA